MELIIRPSSICLLLQILIQLMPALVSYLQILQYKIFFFFFGAVTSKYPAGNTHNKINYLTSKKHTAMLFRHNNARDPHTETRNGLLAFVRIPVGARSFPLHHKVQRGPVDHPASYSIRNRVIFRK